MELTSKQASDIWELFQPKPSTKVKVKPINSVKYLEFAKKYPLPITRNFGRSFPFIDGRFYIVVFKKDDRFVKSQVVSVIKGEVYKVCYANKRDHDLDTGFILGPMTKYEETQELCDLLIQNYDQFIEYWTEEQQDITELPELDI